MSGYQRVLFCLLGNASNNRVPTRLLCTKEVNNQKPVWVFSSLPSQSISLVLKICPKWQLWSALGLRLRFQIRSATHSVSYRVKFGSRNCDSDLTVRPGKQRPLTCRTWEIVCRVFAQDWDMEWKVIGKYGMWRNPKSSCLSSALKLTVEAAKVDFTFF